MNENGQAIRPLMPYQDTAGILKRTLANLAEGVTGIAASDRHQVVLSLGHVVQRLRSGKFLSQLMREWDEFREKGRIKESHEKSEQHQSCLQEMLDFLDKDMPDQIRFDALKKVFIVAATDKDTDSASLLPCEYMRICRTLSSGEIIVLSTSYRAAKKGVPNGFRGATSWLEKIAKDS